MAVHYEVGIVGHVDRARDHADLCRMSGAQFVSVDDGSLGCGGNHLRTWELLYDKLAGRPAGTTDWGVVLEDDAVPIPEFKVQLALALSAAPTPVVSLYLGTGHPSVWQPRIKKAVEVADAWIVGEKLLHGVGYALRTHLIRDLLDSIPEAPAAIDARISVWLQRNHHLVSYANPSLVDHLDEKSVETHPDGLPRNRPRHAWSTGSRDHWRSRPVLL